MWWHTVTHGRGSKGETGEWSEKPVPLTLPRNMVCPSLLPLTRTLRLPVVDWTDARCRFKLTRPFRRKTKSGFCACVITFQLAYTCVFRRYKCLMKTRWAAIITKVFYCFVLSFHIAAVYIYIYIYVCVCSILPYCYIYIYICIHVCVCVCVNF